MKKQTNQSRRQFIRKVAYVAPAVLTLSVLPAHQAVGSVTQEPRALDTTRFRI